MIIRVTADYPAAEVRSLLHFAARQVGIKHAGLVVKVKNSRRSILRGMAYDFTMQNNLRLSRRCQLVTIGITPERSQFPREMCGARPRVTVSDFAAAE